MTDPQASPAIFLDPDQPLDGRIADLMSRMTLEEKASQLRYDSPAIPRLDVPEYNWWNECLHGVARAGRATIFPQAIGLGATFDEDLVFRVATAISDEARAKHHAAVRRGNRGQYCGLTFWTPNINIFRDPRWGRGHETYGEDPYLTGRLGAAFVRGLQGDDPHYLKTAACAKHYAVHSGPEKDRHVFDAVASPKDLRETYLPAFKALVDAGVEAVMGAYNRTNGEPCCGSKTLLQDILRDEWGFAGHVVSDCWAVQDFHANHKVTAGPAESAALAIKSGCDLNCGCVYEQGVEDALAAGLLTEEDIDRALARLLRTRFRLGMFDPPERVPFADTPMDVVRCEAHRELAREAALKSIVLLKNRDGVLPLRDDIRSILLLGPNAASIEALLGNYYGLSDQLVTVLEGIAGRAPEGVSIDYRHGCLLDHANPNPMDWSTGSARNADVVIAVMGINSLIEGEEGDAIASDSVGDRADIGLPPHQVSYLADISAAGTPVVLVLAAGSPLAIPEVHEFVDAVVYMWYPGEQGGHALAQMLYGDESPSGRLPLTFPRSIDQLPPYESYDMAGRTYRYMTEEPLYPFGFGLSYTTFTYGDMTLSADVVAAGEPVEARVTVSNVGDRAAEEVVQLYVHHADAPRAPLCALRDFRRVALGPGQEAVVDFTITPSAMEILGEDGTARTAAGMFRVMIGGSSPGARSRALGSPEAATGSFVLRDR